MNILAAATIMLVSILPTSAGSKHQPPIAYDDVRQLTVQMRVIDIPVLDNDFGPGPESLRAGGGERSHRAARRRSSTAERCGSPSIGPAMPSGPAAERPDGQSCPWGLHHQQRLRSGPGHMDDLVRARHEGLNQALRL
ncbi:MAG: hypothetical protein V9H69_09060 [Anaerolineae bacterium]